MQDQARGSLRSLLLAGLVGPAALAGLLLLLASLWPLDVARRNFQDLARTQGLPLENGRPYLLISRGGSERAEAFSVRVLTRLGWPDARASWLVLAPTGQAPATALTLDTQGRLWGRGGALGLETLEPFVAEGVVLFDDEQARQDALLAWPRLAQARRAHVLAPYAPAGFSRRPFANAWSPLRQLRVTALLAAPLLLLTWLRSRLPSLPVVVLLGASGLLAVTVLLWLMGLSQVTPLPSPGTWPFVAWALAAGLAASARQPATASSRPAWPRGAAGAACLALLSAFVLVHLLRLDLDEDAHAHWALMARAYYGLGHHDPAAVQGHVHSATYPWGYAAVLGLAGWAAAVPQQEFLRISESMGLGLLLYRVGVAGLDLALLGLLAAWLRGAFPGERLWPAGLAVFWAVTPVLRGEHIAAETFLVPLLAGGLLLARLGRQAATPALVTAGLFVAGVGALLKLEGGLLLALAVAPWLLVDLQASGGWRRPLPWAALAVGLLPLVQWRLSLPAASPLYDAPSLGSLLQRGAAVAQSYTLCARFLLRQGLLLPLLALPVACVLYRTLAGLKRHGGGWSLLVPASILAATLGLPLVYVFSHLPREHQIETSLGRLLFLPVFSAWLYAFDTLAVARAAAPASAPERPSPA